MSFVIRAALAIGVLSWLALQRQGTSVEPVPSRAEIAAAAQTAWEALPEAAREATLREGGGALIRHATAAPSSADTLMETDRKPPWRGAQPR